MIADIIILTTITLIGIDVALNIGSKIARARDHKKMAKSMEGLAKVVIADIESRAQAKQATPKVEKKPRAPKTPAKAE